MGGSFEELPPSLLAGTHFNSLGRSLPYLQNPPTLLAGYRACEMEFVLSSRDHWVEAKTATVISTVISTVVSPIP